MHLLYHDLLEITTMKTDLRFSSCRMCRILVYYEDGKHIMETNEVSNEVRFMECQRSARMPAKRL